MTLSISNLDARYGKSPVIKNLSAQADTGDLIGLVGPNGSGKSCLLKTIAGLIKSSSGHIELGGQKLAGLPIKTRAKQIAYLAQDRHAAWPLPVRDLVALGRAPWRGTLGKISPAGEAAIDAALQAAHCDDLKNRRFDRLSGGEQARVHLARALAVDAPLLLADEPIAALDPYYQLSIMDTLSMQAQSGKTVIASLHDLALAKQFCTRVWVLQEGKLVSNAKPDKALNKTILSQVFGVERRGGTLVLSGKTPTKS